MKLNTKLFGKIEIDETRIIHFEDGIIGFPDMKRFLLIHDEESDNHFISWLQSIEEPTYALPIICPLDVLEDYKPFIQNELLSSIEPYKIEDLAIFTSIRVPSNIEEMTSNFRAPFIINSETQKACQIIIEDDRYLVRFPIYEILKEKKENHAKEGE